MEDGDLSRYERLSPRMRESLRLAYDRKTNKQIAIALGVEEGTIKGYVAEAVRILGARGKVDAAELLHAYEATAPTIMEVPSGGVSADLVPKPTLPQPDTPWWQTLPFRRAGAPSNDLSVTHRLVWIALIALGIAFGISAVANTLRVVNDVARR